MMLWLKAFHIIFVVTWFSGLFYLPRLFVYHTTATDDISNNRFKIMERKLLYAITFPSALLTTACGILLLSYAIKGYMQLSWMHLKLVLVLLLWMYTFVCMKYMNDFKKDNNKHSEMFYRYFNEIPSIMLIAIVILVVVKPTLYTL